MRLCARLVPLGSVALLALACGCGGGHDVTEKQLAELRAEITRLRAAQAALTERIDALEIDRGSFGKGAAAPAPAPALPQDRDRPALDVVRLSPSEGDGDADSGAARPVIRAVGSEGSIQPRKAGAPRKGVTAAGPKNPAPPADPRPGAKP